MRPHFHAVRFYEDSDSLCRLVGTFVGEAIERSEPAVVIAVPDHIQRIQTCLQERGIDVNALKRVGDLVVMDARETLVTFMRKNTPDRGAFRNNLRQIVNQVRRGRDRCTVYVYGEMVDVLWKDGAEAAAIRLETLWNELANDLTFKLLCSYSMGNFYKTAVIDEIKAQHSQVLEDTGSAA